MGKSMLGITHMVSSMVLAQFKVETTITKDSSVIISNMEKDIKRLHQMSIVVHSLKASAMAQEHSICQIMIVMLVSLKTGI